jgi:hypothetical protein
MHSQIVPGRSGSCPILRHGARADERPAWPMTRTRRLRDFRTTILVDAAALVDGSGAGDVRPSSDVRSERDTHVDRAGAICAGRAVGRLAVLPSLGAVDCEPQPEHVDADRTGVGAAFGYSVVATVAPDLFPDRSASTAAWGCTSRRPRSSCR